MRKFDRTHLGDGQLIQELKSHVAKERGATAEVLADIAEVDERKLYVPAGYPSMRAYCVGELGLSEDAASKRIHAARAARRFPALFDAVAQGELHLSGLVLLAPHVTAENGGELLAAARGRRKAEIEILVAVRFPKPDVPEVLRAIQPVPPTFQHAPGHVAGPPSQPCQLSPGKVQNETPRSRVKPLAPERFALQMTISRETHDKLQHARDLLSHAVPSGDLANVFDRALDALITKLEKARFAATDKPRRSRGTKTPRAIPAAVKREVHDRDEGRCTFVSQAGKRCESRKFLEFDHIEPVATGGKSTVANLRLRCRAHNQFEADQKFGSGFMHEKRERARPRTHSSACVTMSAQTP